MMSITKKYRLNIFCRKYHFPLSVPSIPWPRPNSERVHFITIIQDIISEEAINTESRQGGTIFHYAMWLTKENGHKNHHNPNKL